MTRDKQPKLGSLGAQALIIIIIIRQTLQVPGHGGMESEAGKLVVCYVELIKNFGKKKKKKTGNGGKGTRPTAPPGRSEGAEASSASERRESLDP